MLLRTLRAAAPNVMRFIVCTGILYIAFLLCGWLVLGPYHPKVSLSLSMGEYTDQNPICSEYDYNNIIVHAGCMHVTQWQLSYQMLYAMTMHITQS